jgi:hypothetical protein
MKALITLAAVLSAVFAAAPAALADAFITTDTLGGNGHPKSTLQHYRLITDTLAPGGGHKFVTDIPVSAEAYRFVAYTDTLASGGNPAPPVGYHFIADTLAPGGGTVVSAPVAGGFDWADAGIGAAGLLGVLLLGLGIALAVVHHRHRPATRVQTPTGVS